MEGSTCKTPPQSGANGSIGDQGRTEEIIISFGRFGLGNNGTPGSQPSMTQSTNTVSSSSTVSDNAPSVREDVIDDTEKLAVTQVSMGEECSSQGIDIDELPASLDMEWPSTSLVLEESAWGQQNIYNTRGNFQFHSVMYPLHDWDHVQSSDFFCASMVHGMTLAENHHTGQERPLNSSWNYTDNDFNHVPANSYGSLRGQAYASSFYEDSSIQNPAASVWNYQSDVYHSGNHMMNDFGYFSSEQFSYDLVSQIRNVVSYMKSNFASSTQFPSQDAMADEVPQNSSLQQRSNILVMARTRDGSEWLQKVLEQGNYKSTQLILNALLDSIFQLMIDDNGYHVFGMLVEKCQNNQLGSIVCKAYSEPDIFIHIAFTDKGSRSIQRLIKRLKKSPMAQIITGILSTRSYELLTHMTGSYVIRQCFLILGEKPNLVLYEAISSKLLDLATDPVGCISLNTCIDSISGLRRARFLEYLAAHSLFLSNDPSGCSSNSENFVVQHMLNLDNKCVSVKILYYLQGSFEQLAQKQGGSHVVEKCMRSSPRALDLVVKEILKNEKALFRLARDLFGNYVIQTALKETKIKDKSLYQALLKALRPYYSYLWGNIRGRHVAELIREDLGLQENSL